MKKLVFALLVLGLLFGCSTATTPPATVSAPIITPNGGAALTTDSITITDATSGALIYYTLDGSTPSASFTPYTAPFNLSAGSIMVKAIAINGADSSAISSASFTVLAPTPAPTPKPNRHIYNSAWQIVGETYVAPSKDLTSDSALADEVAAYNASHNDDQYFLVNGEEVPIQDAPPAEVFVVKASTYEVYQDIPNVPRVDLVTNRDAARLECAIYGDGVLFVDKVPPPPVPVIDTRTDYEKYAIYLVILPINGVEQVSDIIAETHTTADLFLPTLGLYNQQCQMTPGTEVILGRIYPAGAK